MDQGPITRRQLLRAAVGCSLAVAVSRLVPPDALPLAKSLTGRLASRLGRLGPSLAAAADPLANLLRTAPPARFWASTARPDVACAVCHQPDELARFGAAGAAPGSHRHDAERTKCLLCARGCVLKEGERGECGARIVSGGQLRSLVYGRPVAVHLDPIEKKPFYHFLPGALAYSLGTAGCPLHCEFCQNWELSQSRPEQHGGPYLSPERIVAAAAERQAPVIAFTYNEPTVFTEYLTDIARAARPRGARCVLVSCGFMAEAPLVEMCEVLDAIKIDLKGFSEEFYRKVSHAELRPVLRSIRQIARSGVHLEIVNLVVPTLNDSEPMLRELASWLAGEVGPDVPVHFTRFHPDYRLLNLPPTPVETLERARAIARERGLRYVYLGNVPSHPGDHTYCPGCGEIVIRRVGFFVEENRLVNGACDRCRTPIAGVWS